MDIRVGGLVTALGSLIPVLPRRQIKYDTDSLGSNTPCSTVLRKDEPFALYCMSPRYCSLSKISVNTRIVVVGASSTALSFLETLLFNSSSTYLSFNNITLVARHGIPGDSDATKISNKLIIYEGHYNSQYLSMLNLRTWVNLIYGIMTAINREGKYIVINDEAILHYDYLMLFCGEQFEMPPTVSSSEPKECIHGRRASVDDITSDVPQNVFCVNTEIDASNALIDLKRFYRKRTSTEKVVVYGKCLEAYCCVEVLQKFGIPGHKICFVEPLGHDFPDISIFNNNEVDEAVMESLKKNMVEIYSGYFFIDWKFNRNEHKITSARFESKTKSINIDVACMFYYGNKNISKHIFLALEKGQLVFDGRLVIDANFNAGDKYIYAAGPLTKYARRYYAGRYSHCYYNSIEIGAKLGKQMLQMWDPTVEASAANEEIPPLFEKPIIKSCILPGNMHYLKIHKPGIVVPLEAAMYQDDYGVALVTGDCKCIKYDYFRIHLNPSERIETITCYTKNEIDVDNISTLYGVHQQMLNNMVLRFKHGYINDFYSYFREPWCYAIIHDHFKDLVLKNNKILSAESETKPAVLLDVITKHLKLSNWKNVNHTELEEYKNCYKTQYEKMIKDALLEFLVDNSYHLSMYAIPERVKILLQDNKSSPLFMEPEPGNSSESLCSSDSNNSSSSTIKDEVDNENN
ncbi:cilia- and flagella-associated protein 61-like [Periplaneta americana]|uniref:cilia- and flagella-associated protein 61-like n=1 Tax=Periplaneta americana TaxID=6978 RepID=UPI0037E8FA01